MLHLITTTPDQIVTYLGVQTEFDSFSPLKPNWVFDYALSFVRQNFEFDNNYPSINFNELERIKFDVPSLTSFLE